MSSSDLQGEKPEATAPLLSRRQLRQQQLNAVRSDSVAAPARVIPAAFSAQLTTEQTIPVSRRELRTQQLKKPAETHSEPVDSRRSQKLKSVSAAKSKKSSGFKVSRAKKPKSATANASVSAAIAKQSNSKIWLNGFVVTAVTALVISLTLPVGNFGSGSAEAAESLSGNEALQEYVVPETAVISDINRDEGLVVESRALLASEVGISSTADTFSNDPNAAIQWPFPVGVPISSSFGPRWGRLHAGTDFDPGNGAQIQAIADGVVRVADENGGGYGVHVIIDHQIDGQLVSSHYAHMQYGSIQVRQGQQVKVGTIVGLVGNTGNSFGAHLHFEILLNGNTPTDPMPWLKAHAG